MIIVKFIAYSQDHQEKFKEGTTKEQIETKIKNICSTAIITDYGTPENNDKKDEKN